MRPIRLHLVHPLPQTPRAWSWALAASLIALLLVAGSLVLLIMRARSGQGSSGTPTSVSPLVGFSSSLSSISLSTVAAKRPTVHVDTFGLSRRGRGAGPRAIAWSDVASGSLRAVGQRLELDLKLSHGERVLWAFAGGSSAYRFLNEARFLCPRLQDDTGRRP